MYIGFRFSGGEGERRVGIRWDWIVEGTRMSEWMVVSRLAEYQYKDFLKQNSKLV
jgi:hypothetical protein